MKPMTQAPRVWLRVATWGAVAVVARGLWLGPPEGDLVAIERLVGFLLAVAVPVLLAARGPRWAATPVWAASLVVVLSSELSAPWGWVAALPWALVCAALTLDASRELARRRCVPSALRALAQLFLVAGAGWLIASRAGVELPGLDPGKILLACAHATVTGFAALTLLAHGAERVPRARLVLGACGATLGLGFAVTGVGIAASPALEPWGAGVLALALGGFAGFLFLWWIPEQPGVAGRGVLAVGGLALLAGLGFGVTYSLRDLGAPPLERETMLLAHGWVLGAGFSVLGGLGQLFGRPRKEPRELPVLLYDGECGLCTRSVQTILDLERVPSVRFAALQGDTGQALLRRHPVAPLEGPFESLILVTDHAGPCERVAQQWDAVCGIGRRMGAPWRALAKLGQLLVPRTLANLGYALVSRNRMRIFGPATPCKLPTPEQRARFLA